MQQSDRPIQAGVLSPSKDMATVAPSSEDIVKICANGAGAVPVDSAGILEITGRLAINHSRQWSEEDECREPTTTDGMFAVLKRRIDQRNVDRTRLIQEIDEIVDKLGDSSTNEVPLHTETLGCIVDRIVIAWVRAEKLAQHDSSAGARSGAARRQLTELRNAYDNLRSDVLCGRRRFPTWLPLKAYGKS